MFRFFPPYVLKRGAVLALLLMGFIAASPSTAYNQTVAKEFRLDHCGIRYNGHLLRTGMRLKDWCVALEATPRGITSANDNQLFAYVWDDLGIAVTMVNDWMEQDTFVGAAYFTFQLLPTAHPLREGGFGRMEPKSVVQQPIYLFGIPIDASAKMADFNAQVEARGLPAFERSDYDPVAHPEYAQTTAYKFLTYSVCPDITTIWTFYCDKNSRLYYLGYN